MMKILKRGRLLVFCALACLMFATFASAAGSGDVASAVESTWTTASTQIKTVVDNVVFPVIDMVLFLIARQSICGFVFCTYASENFPASSPI